MRRYAPPDPYEGVFLMAKGNNSQKKEVKKPKAAAKKKK
jgi:hypothetical protein